MHSLSNLFNPQNDEFFDYDENSHFRVRVWLGIITLIISSRLACHSFDRFICCNAALIIAGISVATLLCSLIFLGLVLRTSLLIYAAAKDDAKLLNYSIQFKVKCQQTALMLNGSHEMIERADGNTRLIYAVDQGNYKLVKSLLAKGANVNHEDYWNKTALIYAVRKNNSEIIQLLLENGADINHQNHAAGKPSYSLASAEQRH